MTYTEFLRQVSELPNKFRLKQAMIRDDNRLCPWTALQGRPEITKKGKNISHHIWNAADNIEGHDPKIRKDLLRVCKL